MAVESLIIDQTKIDVYLLNLDHPHGWSKAKFFLGRGFSLGAPEGLATALALHATTFWPGRIVSNAYVTKHIVIGPLICPDGSTPEIVAVWKVEAGATVGRLVTAYPHR